MRTGRPMASMMLCRQRRRRRSEGLRGPGEGRTWAPQERPGHLFQSCSLPLLASPAYVSSPHLTSSVTSRPLLLTRSKPCLSSAGRITCTGKQCTLQYGGHQRFLKRKLPFVKLDTALPSIQPPH